ATFEFWATMHQLQNWSRLFSFGSNNADVIHSAWTHGTNRGTDRQEWRDTGGGNHVNRDNTMQPYNDGVEYHIVWTIANAGGDSTVRFFKDGQFRGTFGPTPNKLSMLNMTEAALGRSKWGDATANASYNEFRIYDKVLTDQEIADSGTAGADGLSGAADLTATTIGAAAGSDSTLTLNLEAGLPAVMSGIDVGNAATLTLDSPAVAVELTNMALRGGSTFQSSYAVADAPVTVTVSEKLSTSGGGDFIGDAGAPGTGVGADLFFTNLTLVDGAVPADVDVEWTLTSPTRTDVDGGGMMVAIGDSVNVYGTLDMADGLTIQLVDGLAAGVNASGVDVALFKVSDEAIIDGVLGSAWTPADVAKITVLSPIGAPVAWTWDSLAYLNDEFVVLTNLVTGVHPGDANGDNKVNEEDLVILNDEWGQRGGSLNSDFDGDGDVDLDDFQILNAEFGYDGTGGGAPELPGSETPEPATMTLLALGGLLVIRRRRRKA
ncbi:MAG: PEP-CTERM sorting domain-containing protein, partial [Phycisphaerae bacterium]|nr:PEP-CTERM sorting domain-containing protein [Phycisphaerae bacterium]